MASLGSTFFRLFLKFSKLKERTKKLARKPPRTNKGFVPPKIASTFHVKSQTIDSKTITTLTNKTKATNTHIIFLHGGAYIFEAGSIHWNLAKAIINQIHCKMTMVDYPLAPEYDYKATFQMMSKTYSQLIKDYPQDQFILMGDSAGGGLALAFAQKLVEENAPIRPIKNVLLSPWLDLTMNNPTILPYEKLDYILSIDFLKYSGDQYANGADQNQYLLSPINGNLNDLGDTAVFYGTHELFCPDCRKLEQLSKNGTTRFKFYEYQKMQHDWIVFSISESKKAIKEIIDFIAN